MLQENIKEDDEVSEELKDELKRFIRYLIAIFGCSLFIALLVIYLDKFYPERFKLGSLNSVGGLLQGTLGIAVSFAGAYVAIKLAGLGYTILKRENKRDDYVIINDIVSSAINPIFKIAQEYEKLIDLFKKISDDDKFKRYIREVLEEAIINSDFELKPNKYTPKISSTEEAYKDKDEKDKIELEPDWTFLKELRNKISDLKEALEITRSNQFSYFMFRQLVEEYARRPVAKNMSNNDDEDIKSISNYAIKDFNDVIFYLKSFEDLIDKKIKGPEFNDLYLPYISLKSTTELDLLSFIENGELKLEKIPDANKTMALGLILCRRSSKTSGNNKPNENTDEYCIFNLGGAVLVDLANILLQKFVVYENILKTILSDTETENILSDTGLAKSLSKSPLLKILKIEENKNSNVWFSASLLKAINEIRDKKYVFSFKIKMIKSQNNNNGSVRQEKGSS